MRVPCDFLVRAFRRENNGKHKSVTWISTTIATRRLPQCKAGVKSLSFFYELLLQIRLSFGNRAVKQDQVINTFPEGPEGLLSEHHHRLSKLLDCRQSRLWRWFWQPLMLVWGGVLMFPGQRRILGRPLCGGGCLHGLISFASARHIVVWYQIKVWTGMGDVCVCVCVREREREGVY